MTDLILSCDPDFSNLALDELRTSAPTSASTELIPGVYLVDRTPGFVTIAEQWRAAPPIFVRHICPVDEEISLTDTPADLTNLSEAALRICGDVFDPTLSFSVQTRMLHEAPEDAPAPPKKPVEAGLKPFDINNAISNALVAAHQATLDVRNPQQIISVTILPQSAPDTPHSAFVGLSLTIHNLSGWAGGMRRFARETNQVSRSEFKLLEALEIFQINLPANGVALDLGASPGGWTRILRQRGQFVTAIDPGDLDARLLQDRNIRYKRMTAEAYLRSDPDPFDLIVNDMRMDVDESARLMLDYARCLRPHGIALMTLKLAERERRSTIERAFSTLRKKYQIAGARQLFHNRSEITVYLKLK